MQRCAHIVLVSLLTLILPGCVGVNTWLPASFARDVSMPRKDVIEEFGDPDRSEEGDSILVYIDSTNEWCGVTLYAVILPLPLMAPVCDTETRFLCEADAAVKKISKIVRRGGVSCGPLQYVFSSMMDFGQHNQTWCY